MKKPCVALVASLIFCPNYGWSMSIRPCSKEKILVEIFLAEPDIPVPEAVHIEAYEVDKCDEGDYLCTKKIPPIENVFINTKGLEIPKQAEIDISQLKSCPFVTRIQVEGASDRYFDFHMPSSAPLFRGTAYSIFGKDVKIVVKSSRGH